MKISKLIIVLFLLTICNHAFSQSQSKQKVQDHMKFMGIPINGDIRIFAQKLVEKGFVVTEKFNRSNNCITLTGLFTAKQCTIFVYGTQTTQIAWRVKVLYNPTSFQPQKDHYFELVKDLKKKYGENEKTQEDYESEARYGGEEGIYDILLKFNKKYETFWVFKNGRIFLWAFPDFVNVLTYVDIPNYNIEKRELSKVKKNDL